MNFLKNFIGALLSIWLVSIPSSAANLTTTVLTVTNTPVTGNVFYWAASSGSLRTFTNATTANTILTNLTGVGPAATNLFNALANYPLVGVDKTMTNTNTIVFKGISTLITNLGNWCTIVTTTNSGTNVTEVAWPVDNLPPLIRTNQESDLVYGLAKYSTNAFTTNSASLSNHLSLGVGPGGTVQKATARKFFSAGLDATDVRMTNGFTSGFTNINPVITNANIQGGTGYLGNTIYGNIILSKPYFTNGQFFGSVLIDTNSAAAGNGAALVFNHQWELSCDLNGKISLINDDTGSTLVQFAGPTGTLFTQPVVTSNTLRVVNGTTSDTNTFTQSSLSNNVFRGTNLVIGSISYPRFDLTTLAAGAVNIAVPFGTNRYIRIGALASATTIAGAIGAATSGGPDCQDILLENRSGNPITLAVSTADPIPGNRFAGVDVIVSDQTFANLIYEGTESRWRVSGIYPLTNLTATATNAVSSVMTNGVFVLGAGATNLDFVSGITGYVAGSTVKLGVRAISTNVNQFLGSPLSIRESAHFTNVVFHTNAGTPNLTNLVAATVGATAFLGEGSIDLDSFYTGGAGAFAGMYSPLEVIDHHVQAKFGKSTPSESQVGLFTVANDGAIIPPQTTTPIAVWDEDAFLYNYAGGALQISTDGASFTFDPTYDFFCGVITAKSFSQTGPGQTKIYTNSAPFTTTGIGQTNPIVSGKFWTNTFESRVELFVNFTLTTSAVSGAPSLCFTNLVTGESYNATNSAVLADVISSRISFLLSPNDYMVVTNQSTGNGASSVVSSRAIKQ